MDQFIFELDSDKKRGSNQQLAIDDFSRNLIGVGHSAYADTRDTDTENTWSDPLSMCSSPVGLVGRRSSTGMESRTYSTDHGHSHRSRHSRSRSRGSDRGRRGQNIFSEGFFQQFLWLFVHPNMRVSGTVLS
jgi:hypothetical protein